MVRSPSNTKYLSASLKEAFRLPASCNFCLLRNVYFDDGDYSCADAAPPATEENTRAAPTTMTTTLIVDPVRAEIDEIIDFQEMLDEGLVHDPIPTENPVQMHVEDTEWNIRAGIFLDLDDTTGALAGATDPDALDNDGASSANLWPFGAFSTALGDNT